MVTRSGATPISSESIRIPPGYRQATPPVQKRLRQQPKQVSQQPRRSQRIAFKKGNIGSPTLLEPLPPRREVQPQTVRKSWMSATTFFKFGVIGLFCILAISPNAAAAFHSTYNELIGHFVRGASAESLWIHR
jgi:hypothetical protein